MCRGKRVIQVLLLMLTSVAVLTSCNTIDDERIPAMPVSISLSPEGMWLTYGVSGYGKYRTFVKELREPRNFSWTDRSYSGFGGVLLVSGMDPFSAEAGVAMAYDLSCPVERKRDIRVKMVEGGVLPEAVCPECGSHYDVVERGGAPVSGPALSAKYGLTRYQVLPAMGGGYIIIN